MARALANQAQQTYQTARNLTGSSTAAANSLYNQLNPFYSAELTNPQGLGGAATAAANTAATQSVGGATAGAVGQGNLEAARMRNPAGFATASDEAARRGMQTTADTAANITLQNALLREQQRQMGAQGMASLQEQQNRDVLASLGLQTGATQAGIGAQKVGWFQNMTDLMAAMKPGGSYTSGTGGGPGSWSASVGEG
jgi:hypothetical protein